VAGKAKQRESVVTYLEMTHPPSSPHPPAPAGQPLALMHAVEPPLSFYRYLYNTIGADWVWWERRVMSDEDLSAAIHADGVDIFVLYVGGVPAGYFELAENDDASEIELAYFGLMPDFVGRGYGGYLLRAAIDEAWSRDPKRVWVHTCDMDHPNALTVYQKAGFSPYKQETQVFQDPATLGIF